MESTVLCGMKAICGFCRSISLPSSEATVISLVTHDGFPAIKRGGIWISNTESIVDWTKLPVETEDPAVSTTNPTKKTFMDAPKTPFKKPVNPKKHLKNTQNIPKKHPKNT